MKKSCTSKTVKGYANRKHKFEISEVEMSGYKFITVKKNGNAILTCNESEFRKLQSLFLMR